MNDTRQSGSYRITSFDLPEPGRSLEVLKINNRGQIAGTDFAHTPSGGIGAPQSFLYDAGSFTDLPTIIRVVDINDQGTVYGSSPTQSNPGLVGTNGTFIPTSAPGSQGTYPTDINGLGQIVGSYNNSAGTFGFLESGGKAYRTIAPRNAAFTTPDAVNNLGSIVGVYSTDGIAQHGFLYDRGHFKTIDAPGAIYTGPEGVNDLGTVVGYYVQAVGTRAFEHGFIYEAGQLATFDVPGATNTQITGINDVGQIVGHYTNAAGDHGFIGQAVPSPGHTA